MMNRFPCYLLAALCFILRLSGQDEDVPEPYRSLLPRLQARATEFPLVAVGSGEKRTEVATITLTKTPVLFESGEAFDAIRFRAPAERGLDLVWAFTITETWMHWYIVPATGKPTAGFKNWLNGDRAYTKLGGSVKNPVILQTLAADALEPGREYLLWFSQKKHTPAPVTLKLKIHFAAPAQDKGWDNEAIETVLQLKPAPALEQVAYFDSRGGRILTDPALFHPDDAESHVEHFLYTRRSTAAAGGGFYVTTEIACPPCRKTPKLSEIIARFGEPDCVLTAADYNAARGNGDGEPAVSDRSYYDYFVFETYPADPTGRVQRVSSQYFNTASGKPLAGSLTWADLTMAAMDYKIFYKDGREIGRFVGWSTPDARLLRGKLPAGVYKTAYDNGAPQETMTYDGKGVWAYKSFYRAGPVYRTVSYNNGLLEGALTDFFEDGRTRAEASYEKGRLHGRLSVWTPDGTLARDQVFEHGRLVRPISAESK